MPDSTARSWLRRPLFWELLLLHLGLLAVYAPYVWAGHLGRYAFPLGDLTMLLADGFRAGHTALALEPSPALLAVSHPLDPANRELWIWDVSLYQSKFYIYWGPVPAALLALVRIVYDGVEMADSVVVASFLVLRLGLGAWLFTSLYLRLFSDRPRWQLHLVLLAHGLALPMLSLAARPAVYEVAITAAQCFVTLGFYLAWRSLSAPPERRSAWIWAAGVAMAPALGCRLSLLPAVGFLGAGTTVGAWLLWGRRESLRTVLLNSAKVGLPTVLLVFGLGYYNQVRFGSFTESGVHHQMTANPFEMGPKYLVPNSWTYLFRTMRVRREAPFLTMVGGAERPTPAFIPRPPLWRDGEPVVGLWMGAPFLLLGLLPVLWVLRPRSRARLSPELRWLLIAGGGLAAASYFPVLTLNYTSLRYFGDLLLGALVLSALGLWLGDRHFEGRARTFFRGAALGALAWTLLFSALTPIRLAEHNPHIYQLFRSWFLGRS